MPDYPDINERNLLLLVSEGNEAAFKALFALYARLLFPFLAQLTGSENDAEEIIQETLLRVWIHRDELPNLEKPRSWLFRIASNQAYNWLAAKASRQRTVKGNAARLAEEYNPVEDSVGLTELRKHILAAVNKLPPRRKLIYQLSREEGRSVKEIARELGISGSTVKNSLAEALSFIREELKRSGHAISILLLLFIKK